MERVRGSVLRSTKIALSVVVVALAACVVWALAVHSATGRSTSSRDTHARVGAIHRGTNVLSPRKDTVPSFRTIHQGEIE